MTPEGAVPSRFWRKRERQQEMEAVASWLERLIMVGQKGLQRSLKGKLDYVKACFLKQERPQTSANDSSLYLVGLLSF